MSFSANQEGPLPPYWARWDECPRHYLDRLYVVDQGTVTIAEACRWAYERGLHRSKHLSCRGSYLLREWSRIKDHPQRLRDKIAFDRIKGKQPGGG